MGSAAIPGAAVKFMKAAHLHSVLAPLNVLGPEQRPGEPAPQPPPAERRGAVVQQPQQAALRAAQRILQHLQALQGSAVELHGHWLVTAGGLQTTSINNLNKYFKDSYIAIHMNNAGVGADGA